MNPAHIEIAVQLALSSTHKVIAHQQYKG